MDTATLFDADAAAFSGTVEVLGVIFRAEDDGYAVLEVQEAESGEGFALVGPVAHLDAGDRAEVSGEWQTHSPLRATAAGPGRAAARPRRPRGPGRLPDDAAPHRAGAGREARRRARRGGAGGDRRRPARRLPLAARGQRQPGRGRDRVLARQPGDPRPPRRAGPARARPPRGADPRPLRRAGDGDPARGPLPADRGRRRRVRPRRQDRPRRRRAARVEPPRPGGRGLRARRGRAAGQQLPAAGGAGRRATAADRPDPRPRGPGRGARACCSTEGRAYREPTHASEVAVAATLRARAAAPPTSTTTPARPRDGLTDEQWAAVRAPSPRGSRSSPGARASARPSARGDRRRGRSGRTRRSRSAPRPAARRGGSRRRPATRRRRSTGCSSGCRAASRPSGRARPLPADLVIVDESSMLNLRLIEVLLGGLAESTHVVFVGDADQLPPIGAGKPFEDLIASGVAPVVRLSQIFRQAARSMITTAAHEINQGRPPHLEPGEDQERDFFFIDRADAGAGAGHGRRGRRRASAEPASGSTRSARSRCWRRCTGARSGSTPSTSACRRSSTPTASGRSSDRFRVGDRLIQTRNSHELGLMNGSIVFLRGDDPEEEEILVDTDDGGSLVDPLRRDRDAAARLRDLGPQGPGLRGAGRGRRLPPLARADADPPPASTPRSPAPAAAASWSATGARWRWRCAATTAAAATRAWPSACAADATDPAIRLPEWRRAEPVALGRDRGHARPASPCWRAGRRRSMPELRDAVDAAVQRRHRRSPQPARQPRRRRAAADPGAGPDPLLRLLPGRDRRRRGRLRLRLLPGAGSGDGRLDPLRAHLLGDRPLASPARCSTAGSASERFERIEGTIERGGATLLLAMRLIPILPFSLVSYAAGAARVPTLALHLDDRGRLPADHRPRGLLRHQARGPQPHRPDRARHRRRAARPALRRSPDRPAAGPTAASSRPASSSSSRPGS